MRSRGSRRPRPKGSTQTAAHAPNEVSVPLSTWITLRRRYTRSVNLERDSQLAGSVQGYVLTPSAADALQRVVDAYSGVSAQRAFTLTGVYGTGKSAFALFLAALLGSEKNPNRGDAFEVLKRESQARALKKSVHRALGNEGMMPAIITAQREPLADTVLRALMVGATTFFGEGHRHAPPVLRAVRRLVAERRRGASLDSGRLLSLTADLLAASPAGVLLIIDELGKSLEWVAGEPGSDVFLLQQLAEMTGVDQRRPLLFVGILHQAFGEYAVSLATQQRTEWVKVQGRFEDIPFAEAPEHMLSLTAQAISHDPAPAPAQTMMDRLGVAWHEHLSMKGFDPYVASALRPEVIAAVYPLHPIAALVLPVLCARYAQHERSLFTCLTSNEPHAFARYLREHTARSDHIPTYKISDLYDYFINAAGYGLGSRPQFQRWAEVHSVVENAQTLGREAQAALKTIAALNLLATAGAFRASRALVLASLLDDPCPDDSRRRWTRELNSLVERGIVTYREQIDEYRIWEGSDFDINAALREQTHTSNSSDAKTLAELIPLAPVIAQRHSFDTGTLRYFQRRFIDSFTTLSTLSCSSPDVDGMIAYWISDVDPVDVPARTADGRPLILLAARTLSSLRAAVTDLVALRAVERTARQLQTDGVARREVANRLDYAQRSLEQAVRISFDLRRVTCWIDGKSERIGGALFNARLSRLCDEVYDRGITLWNELINRRELTSQGAKARGELIDAMLHRGGDARLGITGHGPEASLYESVLGATGIHRRVPEQNFGSSRASDELLRNGSSFGPPTAGGLETLWTAVENFCVGARDEPRSIAELYTQLDAPPYGVKRGVVPIILAAVLLNHTDDVSVYHEGSFVPSLGPEHFELLVKHPGSFTVKHFQLTGVRREVLCQLEQLVAHGQPQRTPLVASRRRNTPLLSVVKPLVRFATELPAYTARTGSLSAIARDVRDVLLTAREPDELLFRALPEACRLPPFDAYGENHVAHYTARDTTASACRFRQSLVQALRELGGAYDRQIEHCARLIHTAFGVEDDPLRLRAHLSVRAQYLLGRVIEPTLNRFVRAAVNDAPSSQDWLEGLILVVADRPAETWTDDDAAAFEMRVSDLARRFRNLEALLYEMATRRDGFETRRITITRPTGDEQHHVVWIDAEDRAAVDRVVSGVLSQVDAFTDEQRGATAALLAETLLATRITPMIAIASERDTSNVRSSRTQNA